MKRRTTPTWRSPSRPRSGWAASITRSGSARSAESGKSAASRASAQATQNVRNARRGPCGPPAPRSRRPPTATAAWSRPTSTAPTAPTATRTRTLRRCCSGPRTTMTGIRPPRLCSPLPPQPPRGAPPRIPPARDRTSAAGIPRETAPAATGESSGRNPGRGHPLRRHRDHGRRLRGALLRHGGGGGAGLSVQEPPAQLRRRQPAALPLAEPTVAVPRDQAVEPIPQRPGEQTEDPQQLPWTGQQACDAERRVALLVPAASFDEDDAVHRPPVDPQLVEVPLPHRGLQR